jgi:uncharacterized metal-binding protein/predicted Fe-Mo cluster-binding NifX family protein
LIKKGRNMQIGIPLFAGRVAPRCTIADSILVVRFNNNKITSQKSLALDESNWLGLLKKLIDMQIDTLVCGGINKEDKHLAQKKGISIIENVACAENEIIQAIETKQLRSGYGFVSSNAIPVFSSEHSVQSKPLGEFNCLRCSNKECEQGEICPYLCEFKPTQADKSQKKILEISSDISFEGDRNLCRLSELIYYAVDMNYKKIGVAFCTELQEATEILVSVLRRFFEVVPVSCKIQTTNVAANPSDVASPCNPKNQAALLNMMKTDLNILVGLCVGVDSIFVQESFAPVTTLFVKDKSLANNPIGALYSKYYLKEIENSVII